MDINIVTGKKCEQQSGITAFLPSLTFTLNSPVLQSARPRAVALASYTGVDKIIKSTVGFTRKDI